MSNLRRKSTASSRELSELRRIIRESVADEIILGEGWREMLGIGKKEAPVSNAGKDYAAGEGSAWQALYQISSDSTLGSIMSAWKTIKPQLASLENKLKGAELTSFKSLVSKLKEFEKTPLSNLKSLDLFTTPVNKLTSLGAQITQISVLSPAIDEYQVGVINDKHIADMNRDRESRGQPHSRVGEVPRGRSLFGGVPDGGGQNENLRRGLARLRRR